MRWAAGALLGVTLAASVHALPPPANAPSDIWQTFDDLRGPDCGRHLPRAMVIASDARFAAKESTEDQVAFLWQTANCAYDLAKYDVALRYAERATTLDPENEWPQVIRLYFGIRYERPEASLDALQVLSRIAPERVRDIDPRMLNELLRAARMLDSAGDRSLAVYEALGRAGYVPPAPYFDDFLRMGHARLLMERGRVGQARKMLIGVVDLDSVIELRVDRLFDPLRADPTFEQQLDVVTAIRKDLARSRAAMEANPQLMEAVNLHGMVLRAALRHAEGLALVDRALARDAADSAAYSDADEYRNWLVNLRGNFLYALGRTQEGRAAMTAAAGLKEGGEINVSNIINLGGYLVDEGRAAEAIDLIPRIGQASPYGQGWIESIRSCAGVQLGDEKLRTAGLDYLKSHESDNPAAYSRALLCSGDLDGAAALMIRRLASKDMRTEALLALQIKPDPTEEELPFARDMRARLAALRDRADVREAVDKVGRIERIPMATIAGD
jgi:tetratricopeptide (TPR) repeat protein